MKYITNKPLAACLLLFIALLIFIPGCKNNNTGNERTLAFNKDSARRHIMKIDEALRYTTRFKQNRERVSAVLSKDEYFQKNSFNCSMVNILIVMPSSPC